jgi:endonuclease YncB( thermonuclease family)
VADVDWSIDSVVKIVDGDTLDVVLSRVVGEVDGWTLSASGPARLRLIHLDTPERGEPGYAEATEDLRLWVRQFDAVNGHHLRAITSGKDVFGRYLADVYVVGRRADTASDYMVRERDWDVWLG